MSGRSERTAMQQPEDQHMADDQHRHRRTRSAFGFRSVRSATALM